MRSTPSSVSFCTTSSGRSPLASGEGDAIGGAGAGSLLDGAVGRRAAGRSAPPASGPAPSDTVTTSPGRRRSTRSRWWRSARRSTGASRSATKTCAAAPTCRAEPTAARSLERRLDLREQALAAADRRLAALLGVAAQELRPRSRSAWWACRPAARPAGRPDPGRRRGARPGPATRSSRPLWVPAGTAEPSSSPSSVASSRWVPSAAWAKEMGTRRPGRSRRARSARAGGPAGGRRDRRPPRRAARPRPDRLRRSVEPVSTPAGTSTL